MISKLDLTGRRFSKLKVIKIGAIKRYSNQTKVYWECVCDCGNIKQVVAGSLTGGLIKSCGCIAREKASKRLLKHGLSKDRVYRIWSSMLQRKHQSNNSSKMKCYKDVNICDRWMNFNEFIKDMGLPPTHKHQIDRIDPYGDYEPSNCRWVTPSENMLNQKRNYLLYTEYKDFIGDKCDYKTFRRRILSGFTRERAFINKKFKNQFC